MAIDMIKKLLITLLSILILSCSSDIETPNQTLNQTPISIDKVEPSEGWEGDVIELTGNDLLRANKITFSHKDTRFDNYYIPIYASDFIEQTDSKILIEVPKLNHSDIDINGIDFKYNGFYKIENNLQDIYENVYVLNKDIAFAYTKHIVYMSTDGFFNWEPIIQFTESEFITSFYSLDENNLWIGIEDANESSIYYSSDGGTNVNLKYSFEHSIHKMEFLSPSMGYIIDWEANMYIISNNQIEHIYNSYPELDDMAGLGGLFDFYVVNSELIFIKPNQTNQRIIKINNGIASYFEFDTNPSYLPIFFNNIGYLETTKRTGNDINDFERYLLKTTDYGESWTKIKTFYAPDDPDRIVFINNYKGFALFPNRKPSLYTEDGGVTWENCSYASEIRNRVKVYGQFENGFLFSEYNKSYKYVE